MDPKELSEKAARNDYIARHGEAPDTVVEAEGDLILHWNYDITKIVGALLNKNGLHGVDQIKVDKKGIKLVVHSEEDEKKVQAIADDFNLPVVRRIKKF